MGKKLVIVESPAKAKTIGRYLGKDYRISASVGHIKDLPQSTLGVDVNNGFKPVYITMRGKEKVIRELKELSSDSDFVYIATDPDREGEAIAWHIANALKIDPSSSCRITFNEITKKAVKDAVDNPRTIDMSLVNAQQARRILDRLVGYELSPLLWNKIRKGLSAGRVQSVATRLVMERDMQIDAFVPEEYWIIKLDVTPDDKKNKFSIKYVGTYGDKTEKKKLSCKEDADKVLANIKGKDLDIVSVKKGKKERNPFPPFTTSTLQQEASRRLGFTSRRTMSVAQQLYEGVEIAGQGQTALVSYIRTDSVRISDEAVAASRALIEERFGKEYVCPYKRVYKNKNSAQDAHEAIRPTHFDLDPEAVKASLSAEQYKLYKLIWDRFLSTQMTAASLDTVTVDAVAGGELFRAQGETITFPGFLKAYADLKEDTSKDEEDEKVALPELNEGDVLKVLKTDAQMKNTLPPPHYTEATLIKAMEDNGIGRPSTYAPTISVILERNYVEKKGKNIHITDLGKVVTEMLEKNFSEIVDVSFTAEMERKLDDIETGSKEWTSVLSDFYPGFHKQIAEAADKIEKVKFEDEKTGEVCPECGKGELVIKEGKFGKFIACSRYPDCKYTKNIEITAKGKCPLCGSGIISLKSRKYKGKSFYTCDKKGSDPECGFISWDLPVDDRKCEECGSYMVWKRFRGKSYPRCSNKDCPTNARKKKE
ncbi:MAG: type I DNA topoisomerase [Clostridiales bacterium]|nr:type I DNA topoisomerase [Clostridiales bacterium]